MSGQKYGSSEQARGPIRTAEVTDAEEVPVEREPVAEETPAPVKTEAPSKVDATVAVTESGIEVRAKVGLGTETSVADSMGLLRTANAITQKVARKLGMVAGVRNLGAATASFVVESGEVVYRTAGKLSAEQVSAVKAATEKALEA